MPSTTCSDGFLYNLSQAGTLFLTLASRIVGPCGWQGVGVARGVCPLWYSQSMGYCAVRRYACAWGSSSSISGGGGIFSRVRLAALGGWACD